MPAFICRPVFGDDDDGSMVGLNEWIMQKCPNINIGCVVSMDTLCVSRRRVGTHGAVPVGIVSAHTIRHAGLEWRRGDSSGRRLGACASQTGPEFDIVFATDSRRSSINIIRQIDELFLKRQLQWGRNTVADPERCVCVASGFSDRSDNRWLRSRFTRWKICVGLSVL